MKSKSVEFERSRLQTNLAMFLEEYNQNIPVGYPRASTTSLKEFQGAYPALFKRTALWSMALHRKKVMDWLSSHRNVD